MAMTEGERKERKRERRRAYYLTHREEELSRNRQYHKENRDKILSHQKEYDLKHREEVLSRGREYKLAHREEICLYNRQYREENKDKIRLYREKNRDKILPQIREYHSDNREKALDLYGHKCELCGSVDHLEFHHLNFDGVEERKVYSSIKLNKSLADGNKRSDLQLLCRSCHHKIHNDLRSSI